MRTGTRLILVGIGDILRPRGSVYVALRNSIEGQAIANCELAGAAHRLCQTAMAR